MPTGYTAAIKDGISFEQFVWDCARGFGALVMLRDDSKAPIPERFEPSPTYLKWAEETRAKLATLKAMNAAEIRAAAAAAHDEALASWRKRQAEATDLRNKYSAMLAKVVQWQPPTPDHAELREFMLQQIRESIRFDCSESPAPDRPEPLAWHAKQVAELTRQVARYETMHAEELVRTQQRNDWLAALRKSVPVPVAQEGS